MWFSVWPVIHVEGFHQLLIGADRPLYHIIDDTDLSAETTFRSTYEIVPVGQHTLRLCADDNDDNDDAGSQHYTVSQKNRTATNIVI